MEITIINNDILQEDFDKDTLLSFLDIGYYMYKYQISKKLNKLVEKNIDAIIEVRVKESEIEYQKEIKDTYVKEVNKLQIENIELSKRVEEEYDKAKVQFMIDIEKKSLTIEHLQKLLKDANDTLLQYNDKFDNKLEQMYNKVYQKMINDSVQESVRILKDEVAKKEAEISILKCSNMVKGNFGEEIIADCLRCTFTDAEVINTGKTAHVCDIHLQFPNKHKLVLESKYKSCIQKTDIDKFYKDIEGMDTNVIGGVFVSMVSKNIPNKGSINFEISTSTNKPLMYVGFDNEKDFNTFFPYYITMFVKLCEAYNKHTISDFEVSMLLDEVSFYNDILNKNKRRLDDFKGKFQKYCIDVEDDTKKALSRIEAITNRINIPKSKPKKKTFLCSKCNFSCSSQRTLTKHDKESHISH